MASRKEVREAFPEIEELEDEHLQNAVVDLWVDAVEISKYDSVHDIPRSKTTVPAETPERYERLVPHVRDVTRCTIVLVDELGDRFDDSGIDRDLAITGALVHDISKPYESYHATIDNFGDWLGHPYYAIHLLAEADLPLELQHIVLAHTPNTAVEPQTIEAELVVLADLAAVHGLFWAGARELHPTV